MSHSNGLPTADELLKMCKDELLAKLDQQLAHDPPTLFHQSLAQIYRDEIWKKGQNEVTATMLKYTRQVTILTRFIAFLTVVTTGATIWSCYTNKPTPPSQSQQQ